jgi:hypothetical protein
VDGAQGEEDVDGGLLTGRRLLESVQLSKESEERLRGWDEELD